MTTELRERAREWRDQNIGRGAGLTITTNVDELLASFAEKVLRDGAAFLESELSCDCGWEENPERHKYATGSHALNCHKWLIVDFRRYVGLER